MLMDCHTVNAWRRTSLGEHYIPYENREITQIGQQRNDVRVDK